MRSVRRSLAALALTLLLAAAAMLLESDAALAHTGENASVTHVIIEVGRWSFGVAAVLALLVGLFWIRASLRRRGTR